MYDFSPYIKSPGRKEGIGDAADNIISPKIMPDTWNSSFLLLATLMKMMGDVV